MVPMQLLAGSLGQLDAPSIFVTKVTRFVKLPVLDL